MAITHIPLSVAIAVFNEECNIGSCLESVKDFANEIIIVDGGSTDGTVNICRKYTDKIIITDNPAIFHINKQKALDASKGPWILQLDADEVITAALKEEIIRTVQSSGEVHGYYIPRSNYFWGHFMKKGGQYPDYVIRLIHKNFAHFPCKHVHEQIEVSGETAYLKNPMLHYSYQTRADYWKKADTYTTLTARQIQEKPVKGIALFVEYCIIKPVLTFVSIFIRHKGFIDGSAGFEFSLYSGFHFMWAYYKYLNL